MYGTHVPSLSHKNDPYWFVDEREIRIATGITLMLGTISLSLVVLKAEYLLPLIFVSIIVLDFLLKVAISPKWSIFGSFVRIFLKKWKEVWVWAVQKRFAWSIGILLSLLVLYCILLLGEYISPIEWPQKLAVTTILENIENNKVQNALIITPMNPAIIACLLCIIFMWSESVVGYCVGCHIYGWLVKKWWMKAYKWQNCIDGSCEIP